MAGLTSGSGVSPAGGGAPAEVAGVEASGVPRASARMCAGSAALPFAPPLLGPAHLPTQPLRAALQAELMGSRFTFPTAAADEALSVRSLSERSRFAAAHR